MTDQKDSARKKAELISNGKIYIPNDIKLPYPLERSTAGPGSGSLSITLTFENKNIKLEVSKNQNELFTLQKKHDTYHITKRGENFLEDVQIIPTVLHAPRQAFINLENRCIYNCAFCNLSEHRFLQNYDKDKFKVKAGAIAEIIGERIGWYKISRGIESEFENGWICNYKNHVRK